MPPPRARSRPEPPAAFQRVSLSRHSFASPSIMNAACIAAMLLAARVGARAGLCGTLCQQTCAVCDGA
jgi:hypothetical protein